MLLAPQDRSAADWRALKTIFIQNLVINQERGRAATGLAVMQNNGAVQIEKASVPAAEFVQTPAFNALLQQITSTTTLLLGHTRNPTKGSPANSNNNHPIQTGPVFGIHNGHINNDDDLFTRLQLPRQAQVDSEVIFRLLEQHSPLHLNGNYLAAIEPNLRCLQGKFTFLAGDRRAAGKLLVVKHQNPLSVYYHPQWNALIFSSSYLFLRKTFGPAVIYQTLPRDQLLHFDAAQLAAQQHHPVAVQPLFFNDRRERPGF